MTDDLAKHKIDLQAALHALPIFPLGEVVLFPNALLPLHIFEPRYRTMLKDCLASHGAMAIAHVPDPTDVDAYDNPRIASIAGAGCIVGHEAFPDGRASIVLRGVARVHLEELPFVPPYRRAHATVLYDDPTSATEADRTALFSAATAFASSVRKHDSSFSFEVPANTDSAQLADICAHHLMVDPKGRQAVLEERNAGARVRAVMSELMVQQRALFGPSSGVLH